MAQAVLIVSLLSGVALAAIVAFIAGHGWHRYTPAVTGSEVGGAPLVARTAEDPTAWAVAFVVAILGVIGATVLFVGGGGGLKQGAGVFLAGGAAVAIVAYLFYGTVIAALGRGLANSQAVALGSSVLGLLGIVVITLRLLGVI